MRNLSVCRKIRESNSNRSEEHTSELQSPCNLVCRLLLEKKKSNIRSSRRSSSRARALHLAARWQAWTSCGCCEWLREASLRPKPLVSDCVGFVAAHLYA